MRKQERRVRFLIMTGILLLSANLFSQDPNFYIYLCFGQSNMEGQGLIQSQDSTVDSRFLVFQALECPNLERSKAVWYPAVPPLCQCWSGLSPADYFGRTMVANLPDSIKVGVINVAVGGCDIRLFDKDIYRDYDSTYAESWFTTKVKDYGWNPYEYLTGLAKLAQHDGVIKGILLHQGETNTGDVQWPSYVKKIYTDMLTDLSLDANTVPLLAGELLSAEGNCCSAMNTIIDRLPETIPTAYVISSGGCTGQDEAHFDSEGYRKLGSRYAMKMLSLMGYETAPSTAYTPEVENRLKQVENSLMSWVQTPDTLKWSLNERMKTYNIHGLSIAVINNYKVEWAKGYGWADISEQRPVTAQTLFQAASISKSLNGVGILKLVQDSKLDLNTDINLYLKSWKFPYDSLAKGKKITIANLLSHTAGLTVHGFPGYEVGADLPSITQILDGTVPSNTEPVRSMFEPGIKFQYSGGGITILQLIITDITGQRYDDFMLHQVLRPMGMKSSSYTQPPPAGKSNLLATAYLADGTGVTGKFHIYPEQAAAGLWTNPVDLGNYIIETQLSYQGKSDKVLSPEMTKLRLTPCMNGSSALGVFIENRGNTGYFVHSGGNAGFRSRYCGSLDDGTGVVVMVNSDNGSIIDEIINSVATIYHWKDFYKPIIKKVISVPDSILSYYAGNYLFNGMPVSISLEDGRSILTFMNTSCPMYFTSESEFFMTEFRGDNKFLKDSDGKITGFSIDGNTTVIKKE